MAESAEVSATGMMSIHMFRIEILIKISVIFWGVLSSENVFKITLNTYIVTNLF
jgi:hypothetical protein